MWFEISLGYSWFGKVSKWPDVQCDNTITKGQWKVAKSRNNLPSISVITVLMDTLVKVVASLSMHNERFGTGGRMICMGKLTAWLGFSTKTTSMKIRQIYDHFGETIEWSSRMTLKSRTHPTRFWMYFSYRTSKILKQGTPNKIG